MRNLQSLLLLLLLLTGGVQPGREGLTMQSLFANIGRPDTRILMVGLDNAGKSTILYKLKLGEIVTTTTPMTGFTMQTVEYKNVTLKSWDLGGYDTDFRQYIDAQGLIFVIDSNDRERIDEARKEFNRLFGVDELRDAVLLILANKQDLPNALSAVDITDTLGLLALRQRSWHVEPTCATSGEGLYEGLVWLTSELMKGKGK